jgi:hypothetical protein
MWCLLWPSDPCQLSAYGVAKPNSGDVQVQVAAAVLEFWQPGGNQQEIVGSREE